jgi:serine/threonine-protein kinase
MASVDFSYLQPPVLEFGARRPILYHLVPFCTILYGIECRLGEDGMATALGAERFVQETKTTASFQYPQCLRRAAAQRDPLGHQAGKHLLQDGRPMVMDFGIALAVSAAAGGRLTESGLSLGTGHYKSSEQATAEKELTSKSDSYSLGYVLYEMLTGQAIAMCCMRC